jgi:hypothetical protein
MGKVELVEFKKDNNGDMAFVYSVEHNNGDTSVEQKMTISSVEQLIKPEWVATIELNDMRSQHLPKDAALKLADWLERLAKAIRVGEYQDYPVAEFKDA